MELSRYNWIVEHKADTIAYNGFTGAMAVLEKDNIDSIRNLFSNEGQIDGDLEGMGEDLITALKHGGYIIEDGLDERAMLRIAFNSSKYNNQGNFHGYTLVMTRRCNFRCGYCFEHDTLEGGDSITDKVLDQVVKNAEESTAKFFSLTLYGGEPLLEYEKCLVVAKRCKEVVEKRGAKFGCGLISNGYLLTPERARALKESGVTHIQITIDGSKETHNANRPLANGAGTYDKIISNIKECAGIVELHIRMNVKRADMDEINELRELVSSLPLTDIHIAAVDLSCQGDHEFYSNVKEELADVLPVEQTTLKNLHSTIGGCGANSLKPGVVLPNGKLVRCWEHLEDYESSCSIFDNPLNDDIVTFSKWVGWDPYMPGSQCYECRYLPGCGGGCPRSPVMNWGVKCLYVNDSEYISSIEGSYIALIEQK
ncbi:MAG: radical SAM protein [Candidatus Sabulitectum sp.]|nr:radical SAM protein [Candidatus Sabulitectum sp.]